MKSLLLYLFVAFLAIRTSVADTKPFFLRIAPLGASITYGYLSSDGNGYRKYLRDELRLNGWPVNMVGSVKNGTMNDNDNEGHPGWTIQQVTSFALPNIVKDQPNLVLINVGTNNAIQDNSVSTASDLYIQLLDKLWDDIPNATVILSTLLRNEESATDTRVEQINKQIRSAVKSHYRSKKLLVADMDDGFITKADLKDGTHPTDEGYKKMAAVWWDAIRKTDSAGWLSAPPDTGTSDNATTSGTGSFTCPKVYGSGDGNYQIQKGSGTDDGNYVYKATTDGSYRWVNSYGASSASIDHYGQLFFAQLVNKGGNPVRGGEVDEIIWRSAQTGKWHFWINNNNDQFDKNDQVFDPGYTCQPANSRFADLNNDGLDDFLCIDADGNLWASINQGGNPPKFKAAGIIGAAPDFWSDGYTADRVHIADIDGDGRADWCILLHSGDISCHRNGGQGDVPTPSQGGYWQDFQSGGSGWTTVFPSQHKGNAAGVHLVDINGDFKADWVFVHEEGRADIFINNRGTGVGLVPHWRQASGPENNFGPSTIHGSQRVKFGRMYGTGRRDYIWLGENKNTDDNRWHIAIEIFKNLGKGATTLKGDGTHYCDMNGDGKDDYIWVGPNGEIDIYLNTDNRPYWDNHMGVITQGVPRKTIHVADLDGDGKCDLLSVDRATGAVRMWLNRWDGKKKKFSFADHGVISGSAGCKQGYGVIENDLGVRFADLTGDGKSDYLCIETNGRVTGFLNQGMTSAGKITFKDVGQIKKATQYDRQNVRFNDVNGDGRADLIWVNKYNGHATVWYNGGQIPTDGSAFQWNNQGVLYKGWDRGANMHFGALGGQHRADMIQVLPATNQAYISYNKCPGGKGGDDANWGDPKLPQYSTSSNTTCPLGQVCAQSAPHFVDDSCSAEQQAIIRQELDHALNMAIAAQGDSLTGKYYQKFFPDVLRDRSDFEETTRKRYENMQAMLSADGTAEYDFQVTCAETITCKKNAEVVAYMKNRQSEKIWEMNACPRFFVTSNVMITEDFLTRCKAKVSSVDLDIAGVTRSAVLLHEMTHTAYAMFVENAPENKKANSLIALDYAYGYDYCAQIAAGTYSRDCMVRQMKEKSRPRPLCPNKKNREGKCAPEVAEKNADTYMFVAAGIYFSQQCGGEIRFPGESVKRDVAVGTRQDDGESCPSVPNFRQPVTFDGSLGTYVHFGDSFAAGMGTGTTGGAPCRIGSNNFGKLLSGHLNQTYTGPPVPFELRPCSGASLTGLTKQVDAWDSGPSTSFATLSIGGNDVNFTNLVKDCILVPNWFTSVDQDRANCVEDQNKAYAHMADTSTSGLRHRLKEAYLDIVRKAGTYFFTLYVTGYPHFFNAETHDCNFTAFNYWRGDYFPHRANNPGSLVLLTESLRAEMNTLVQTLNSVIQGAVEDALQEVPWQVKYVDIALRFTGGRHHWCENPNAEFHEPYRNRKETWFFLSSWPDVPIEGAADVTDTEEAAAVAAIIDNGSFSLPDAATCSSSLGTDPDPYAVALCDLAINVEKSPDGDEAQNYAQALQDVANRNSSSEFIRAALPMRYAKTFHPRSPGMAAYRDAILEAMNEMGQL